MDYVGAIKQSKLVKSPGENSICVQNLQNLQNLHGIRD
jgi:hypothetical protein